MAITTLIIVVLCISLVTTTSGTSLVNNSRSPLLEVYETLPCVERNGTVKRLSMNLWVLYRNFTLCESEIDIKDTAFRVFTSTDTASVSEPIVFVARDSNDVQTWKVPDVHFDVPFYSSYRTICTSSFNISDILLIDSFTSSLSYVSYNIIVEPVENFILELSSTIGFYIKPNAPQVYFFRFDSRFTDVQIVATSNSSSGCALVSVQNASCPLIDLEAVIRSQGVFQTMTTTAIINIHQNQVSSLNGLFIVVVQTNRKNCYREHNDVSFLPSQYIELTVQHQKPADDYVLAMILPILICTVFGFAVILIMGCPLIHIEWNPFTCGSRSCGFYTNKRLKEQMEVIEEKDDEEQDNEIYTELINENRIIMKGETQKKRLLDKKEDSVKISHLLTTNIDVLEKQYSVYAWNTLTVGIFYGLPAFQFVLTGELIFRASGNQDTCYFNFKCSRSLGVLDAFNSVWSNVGYLVFGLCFIIIVGIRHYKARQEKINNPKNYFNYGIPHFFGIYYSLGVALVLEGFMSSCYHICPSFDDFQFDSAFMYIISGLLIVKIFQTRHPDIHANAFVAFLCFAVVIFLTLIGIHEDTMMYWSVRVLLVFLVLLTISTIWLSFYFYHDWQISNWIEWSTYRNIWYWFKDWFFGPCNDKSFSYFLPRHMGRFAKVVIAAIVNTALGILIISVSHKEVAVIVLALFIANFLLYTLLYLLSKLWYKEPWTLMALLFFVALSVSWILGFYFLLNVTARREVTPAQSREYNSDCILLDFYDIHDLWHFISALALFFTFLFVMTMDDGLQRQKRNTINVF